MAEIQTETVETALTPTAGIRRVVPADEISTFFDFAYTAVVQAIQEQGASIAGPAFARYFSIPSTTFDLEAGFPTDVPIKGEGDVVADWLPAGRAARAVHFGPYDRLPETWDHLHSWIKEHGYQPTGPIWEVYVTMPTPGADPADMRTDIFISVE